MRASRVDLKLRLALRVSALAALCSVAALAVTLFDIRSSAKTQTDRIAQMVALAVALQQQQSQWVKGATNVSSGFNEVAAAVMEPGLCIAYRALGGDTLEQVCYGSAPEDSRVPWVFAAAYDSIFDAGIRSVRPVRSGGAQFGEAVASTAPVTLIGRSWRQSSRLTVAMAGAFLALCVLMYAALAAALRPTRVICSGVQRLASGDLSARLPPFDLAELSAVGSVFNQLASSLETAVAECSALTRQLIEVQDEERRRLARELHDEFGQYLAAIAAVAASAGQVAQHECPALVSDCNSIVRTTAHMMEMLRSALLQLRPPDVDALGLAASLASLVAGWNSAGGGTQFSIDLSGDFDELPVNFAENLYRVAQEAITNAAKHAQASRVTLRLCMRGADCSNDRASVHLVVADDGKAGAGLAVKSGMGLLSMRERIASLGGRLRFETAHPSGLVIHADIPVPPNPKRSDEMRVVA
jgi:signal transduction histidine kinase